MMANLKLRGELTNAFKMHGLQLRQEAVKYGLAVVSQVQGDEFDSVLERLVDAVMEQPLKSNLVEKRHLEEAVKHLNAKVEEEDSGSNLSDSKLLHIISAFNIPRFKYLSERKKIVIEDPAVLNKKSAYGDEEDKLSVFLYRYDILLQRTIRHKLFSASTVAGAVTASGGKKKFCLKPIEYLLASSSKLGELIVLGMLSQLKHGKYFLEDPTGFVELDLSKTVYHSGIFTESSFVLAEGWYDDKLFHVTAMGFPPTEASQLSRQHLGNVNYFGTPATSTCLKASPQMQDLLRAKEDSLFVFLSDVFLDQASVMKRLQILLAGYSTMPPTCFVLCGNFHSKPHGKSYLSEMKELFAALADLVADHASILRLSHFVFVPGPLDPGLGSVLPRPPIPPSITASFKQKVPNSTFTSNPCRIQYCSREIVIFRENLLIKMCRNSIHLPDTSSSSSSFTSHFAKTLLGQAHLSPLPVHLSPVYWTYDHALSLYPNPDLVVVADTYDPYEEKEAGNETTLLNPGSFTKTGFSFKVYYPSTGAVEDCQVPGDM